MRALGPFTLCLSLLSSACLTGSGVSETRDFDVFGAGALEHRTLLDVEVRRGPKARLEVTCDDNLLDAFRVRVDGDVLVIDQDDRPLAPRTHCRAEVELPALAHLESDGSGSIEVLDAFSETRIVALSGSGSVVFRGPVTGLARVELSGSGSLDLPEATGCETALRASGSGSLQLQQLALGTDAPCAADIELSGSGSLRIDALYAPFARIETRGSGSVRAAGQTPELEIQAVGSGSVRARELVSSRGDLEGLGSGSIETTVTEVLRVRLTGSGDAVVSGNPALRDVVVTGSGKLRLL